MLLFDDGFLIADDIDALGQGTQVGRIQTQSSSLFYHHGFAIDHVNAF